MSPLGREKERKRLTPLWKELGENGKVNLIWQYHRELHKVATVAGVLMLVFTVAGLLLGFSLGYETGTMSGTARFSFHAAAQHLRSAWECAIYAMQVW